LKRFPATSIESRRLRWPARSLPLPRSELLGDPADADATSKIEQLIDDIVKKMQQQGYITGGPDFDAERERREGQGGDGPDGPPATFEATDKTIDFLGYRALRDLLGSLGKSSAGRHDTRDLSTGIEAEAAPKQYEFGDTMNLDASATLLHAVQRTGLKMNADGGLDVDYEDLMVSQGEYQSSCATVLMLDVPPGTPDYAEALRRHLAGSEGVPIPRRRKVAGIRPRGGRWHRGQFSGGLQRQTVRRLDSARRGLPIRRRGTVDVAQTLLLSAGMGPRAARR
jgi:hypothetical protein